MSAKRTAVGGDTPTNGAAEAIGFSEPYTATVTIQGITDLLFHRWNVEGVEEKAKAAKGSKAKKTDNIESYVYRNEEGYICLPGEYLRMSVIMASKFKQDPRSPRKSLFDLAKAAIISLTTYASLGCKDWDYEHKCRVTIQRNAITRCRPAIKSGWEAKIQLMVNLPEYVSPALLHELITSAGKLIGVGDFRPTYGRFHITSFDIGLES